MAILRTNRLAGLLLALTATLLVAISCGGGSSGLSEKDVKNATYSTQALREGQAALTDGEFRAPAAPGSATEIVIQVVQFSIGDLNGDGDNDAAVILREETGGSGTFYSVHALLDENGKARDAASQFLGDRIQIDSVKVASGEITVDLLDRPADAPFSQAPTVPVTKRFRLQGSDLTEVP